MDNDLELNQPKVDATNYASAMLRRFEHAVLGSENMSIDRGPGVIACAIAAGAYVIAKAIDRQTETLRLKP